VPGDETTWARPVAASIPPDLADSPLYRRNQEAESERQLTEQGGVRVGEWHWRVVPSLEPHAEGDVSALMFCEAVLHAG
jgi:hypothetical protein